MAGLAIEVAPFEGLDISMAVRALRPAGRRRRRLPPSSFSTISEGRSPGTNEATIFCPWSDSFDWRVDRAFVRVPPGARRAVLQIEKLDSIGAIRFDDVRITASPNPAAGSWTPFHVADETDEWLAVPPSRAITARSALDVSFLLHAPAGGRGSVTVKDGHLTFGGKERARFFGVCLLPPAAFLRGRSRPSQLADRLARSGINLVRLGDLDTAYGPNRSLFDDTRDDTKEFDPVALERLDHLIAALKKRGIYVAIELPEQAPVPSRRRGRASRPAPFRRRAGGHLRPHDRPARARHPRRHCSATRTRRPSWRSRTTRPWPGSPWPARRRCST